MPHARPTAEDWEQLKRDAGIPEHEQERTTLVNNWESIVREFVADVQAAYGSQGQDDEEVIGSLAETWSDLAETYKHAIALVDQANKDRA